MWASFKKDDFFELLKRSVGQETSEACEALRDAYFAPKHEPKGYKRLRAAAEHGLKENLAVFRDMCDALVFEDVPVEEESVHLQALDEPAATSESDADLDARITQLLARHAALTGEVRAMAKTEAALDALCARAHECSNQSFEHVVRKINMDKVDDVTKRSRKVRRLYRHMEEMRKDLPNFAVDWNSDFSKHRRNMPSARDLKQLAEHLEG